LKFVNWFKNSLIFLFLLAALPAVMAQTGVKVVGILENFEFPERDDQGKMLYLVKGSSARPLGSSKVEIKDATIVIYSPEEKEDMVVSIPLCILDQSTREVSSDQPVRIVRDNITITGQGLEGTVSKDSGGVAIKENVRVEIEDLEKGIVVPVNQE